MTSWCFKNRFTFLKYICHFWIFLFWSNVACIWILPVSLVENNITETDKYKISHSFLYFSSDLGRQSCPACLSRHNVIAILWIFPSNLTLDIQFTVFSILYWWCWAFTVNRRQLSTSFPPAPPVTAVLIEAAPHFYVFSLLRSRSLLLCSTTSLTSLKSNS